MANPPLHQVVEDPRRRPGHVGRGLVGPDAAAVFHPSSGIEIAHRHPGSLSSQHEVLQDQLLHHIADFLPTRSALRAAAARLPAEPEELSPVEPLA